MAIDSMYLGQLKQQISAEFPGFKIVPKASSRLMRMIDVFMKIITFGKMKLFMTNFVTTLGVTVYVPLSWDTWASFSQAAVLRHERVHMRQARRLTTPFFKFLYLFPILPLGLAYFRARFEMEAYEETLRAYAEFGTDIANPALKEKMLRHFTTAEYGWMWPFQEAVGRWYDRTVLKILSESK